MILKRITAVLRRLLARLRGALGQDRAARRKRRGRRRRQGERPPTALGTFGARIGRHAGIYGAGQGASLVLGLVTLAVLTRFLEPEAYGQYALYYFLAILLTTLYTMGWTRGGLLWVFGAGGDDDDDEEEDEESSLDEAGDTAEDKRRALGTAITLIALVAGLGTAAVALAAPPLAELLTGDPDQGRLALLSGAAGAVGALWAISTAVARRERRPPVYVLVTLARPVLILAATIPLVAVDPEVDTAVLGLAIGTGAAALVGLAGIRRSFTPALGLADARSIARLGARYVPLIVSLWVIANGGVFFVGQYASVADAGFFRVASGVAAVASLPVSAFITAWGPLRREPIYGAVEAERGKLAAAGILTTYFALAAIGIFLALVIGADLLVQIAPGAYADAAPLIPILGLGLLLQGWFRVLKRSAKFPRRWVWYVGLAVVAGTVFVGACVALVPPLGADGAALAVVAAFLVAAIGMSLRSQLGGTPIPISYRRLAGGLAIAGACFAAARLLGDAAGPAGPAVDAAAVVAYPLLLLVTGIVPPAHVAPLRKIATAAVPRRSGAQDGRVELNGLDDLNRAVLEVLVRHARPVDDVAPVVGMSQAALAARFVAALRQAGGVEGASPADPAIGAYLLSSAPVAARDRIWRRLQSQGANALEVDALTLTLERLRRAPLETWRR